MTLTRSILATIVMIVHFLIIVFTVVAPFSESIGVLVLHVTWAITLVTHWVASSNACSMTLLESQLRGIECTETFMHRLISPFYDMPEGALSKICYVLLAMLLSLSVYKLATSDRFKKAVKGVWKGENRGENIETIFSVRSMR